MRALLITGLTIIVAGLTGFGTAANGASREAPAAGASIEEIDSSSIYRGLELQGAQLAYLIHEAQIRYRDEHGHWAEYQGDLEAGYLEIPPILLQNAGYKIVAMHDLESPGMPVSSYDAEITVRDPQSGWQYGCVVDYRGRISDIADTHENTEVTVGPDGAATVTELWGSKWPRPLLNNCLPMTLRLREAALQLSAERGITDVDKSS